MGAWCFSFPKYKSCHYSTRFSPTSLQQKTVTKNYFFKSLKFLLWPNTVDKGAESEPLKLKYNIFLPFKKKCAVYHKSFRMMSPRIFDAQTKRFLAHSYALKALFYGHKVEMHEKIH